MFMNSVLTVLLPLSILGNFAINLVKFFMQLMSDAAAFFTEHPCEGCYHEDAFGNASVLFKLIEVVAFIIVSKNECSDDFRVAVVEDSSELDHQVHASVEELIKFRIDLFQLEFVPYVLTCVLVEV